MIVITPVILIGRLMSTLNMIILLKIAAVVKVLIAAKMMMMIGTWILIMKIVENAI